MYAIGSQTSIGFMWLLKVSESPRAPKRMQHCLGRSVFSITNTIGSKRLEQHIVKPR